MWDESTVNSAQSMQRQREERTDGTVDRQTDFERGGAPFRLTWLLALLATLTLEIAVADGDRSGWSIALTVAAEAIIAGLLGVLVRQMESNTSISNRDPHVDRPQRSSPGNVGQSHLIWILVLATVPFVIEVLVRGARNEMLPLELLLLADFRNGVLALAVFAHRNDCARLCGSLSTFLTIFAAALSAQMWIQGLVVIFAIVGICWLMGTYWDSLAGRLAATSESESSQRWLIAIPLIVIFVLLGIPVAVTQTYALSGFMPSSGGTDSYSDKSRSGIGDGDALVAGTDNIQSFAPIENAPFMNSHEPSLYDLFDDSYNEPVKIQKQDRAIALPQMSNVKQNETDLAESKKAGKEFSTLRKQSNEKQKNVGDLNSNALFYVKGRLPVHLKLEIFDQYNGIEWFPEALPAKDNFLSIKEVRGKPWLQLPISRSLDLYGLSETHALKILRLDTNRIPAPTQLIGIHVDQVDRSDFFEWAQPGIVRMDREKLPEMVALHVQSRTVDVRLIPNSFAHFSGGPAGYRDYGSDQQSQRIQNLAKEWTNEISIGWPQIEAIVSHLRNDYIHDRDARPPVDCEHTVADFLFESRRGPDYQFASAAVLMLRAAGYSARLVSGFHVGPSRYESRSRHASVMMEDVHFWAEVRAGNEDWLPIEPTPGYELLKPPPTLMERLLAAVMAVWSWIAINSFVIAPSISVGCWLLLKRRWVSNRIATWIWEYCPIRDERAFVRQTLDLLDHRSRWAGHVRPPGTTPTRWLSKTASNGHEPIHRMATEFIQLAEWADFAPDKIAPPTLRWRDVCRQAVSIWSWENLIQSRGASGEPRRFQTNASALHDPLLSQVLHWPRKVPNEVHG